MIEELDIEELLELLEEQVAYQVSNYTLERGQRINLIKVEIKNRVEGEE